MPSEADASKRRLTRGGVGRLPVMIALVSGSLLLESGRRHVQHRAPALARAAAELTDREPRRPTLLFLFQPGDCIAFSALLNEWNDLYAEGDVTVVGIGIRFSAADRQVWASAPASPARPRFPVRFDLGEPVEELILDVGHALTPAAVLLDRQKRARLFIPPVKDGEEARRLSRIVRAHVELMKESSHAD